jgi:hypothetical protein
MWRLLLHGFERSHGLIHDMMNGKPRDEADHQPKPETEDEIIQRRLLPPLDGGDDRRTAMRTRPRMVADLSAAFVALDEGHIGGVSELRPADAGQRQHQQRQQYDRMLGRFFCFIWDFPFGLLPKTGVILFMARRFDRNV